MNERARPGSSWVKSYIADPLKRMYPTRQIYFRANGKVRFLSLSPLAQISATVVLLGILGWMSVATINYIFLDDILARKDRELADSRKAFDTLNSDMTHLQDQIQGTMKTVQAKQRYLESLLDDDDTDAGTDAADAGKTEDAAKGEEGPALDSDDAPDGDDGSDAPAGAKPGVGGPYAPPTQDAAPPPVPHRAAAQHSSFLLPLKDFWHDLMGASHRLPAVRSASLKVIEAQIITMQTGQQHLTQELIGRSRARIAAISNGFKTAGLSADAVLGALEPVPRNVGGPFEALPDDERALLQDDSDETFQALLDMQEEVADFDRALGSFPVAKPLKDSYYVSSGFGIRHDPFKKTRAMHAGLDMAGHWKEPIYATAPGVVVKAGWNGAYGRMVEIDHGNGFKTRYGHMQAILVKKGQHVSEGERIGLMGTSGRSTGTHLHYEVRFLDKPYNPLKFFKAEQHVLKFDNS